MPEPRPDSAAHPDVEDDPVPSPGRSTYLIVGIITLTLLILVIAHLV